MTKIKKVSGTKFLFTIPLPNDNLSVEATTAIQMGALASRLVVVERTRTDHPDGRAENDAEHSLMLAKVAPELAELLYPELDVNLVARFATLHDDVEAYVGDTPTDSLSNLDQAAKQQREAKGLKQLIKDYTHMPNYVKLVRQYEAQSLPEARFIRAVDKLMVMLIHFPNNGKVLIDNYSRDIFLQNEISLLKRDRFKYGEFDKIANLRLELGRELADRYLKTWSEVI